MTTAHALPSNGEVAVEEQEEAAAVCNLIYSKDYTQLLILAARSNRPSRGNFPPFIHFTLQKTNRDTQDAISYLSRVLHVNAKDLAVAGTKDKRGVSVQRVSLKRGNRTVEDIWKVFNGQNGRKSLDDATKRRGDHGVRISDFNYGNAGLELGMLKGNAFVITLRSAKSCPICVPLKLMLCLGIYKWTLWKLWN